MWQDIPKYEGYYQCSTDGEVRGVDRLVKHPTGMCIKKGKVLKQNTGSNGYKMVSLLKEGRQMSFTVHSLMARTFLAGYDPSVNDVNHKDGNKASNRLVNLEIINRSGNIRHAYANGLRVATRGNERYNAKLNEISVRKIRQQFACGNVTKKELGNEYGVSATIIAQIINRKKWAHVE